MPTPSPADMVQAATDILNAFLLISMISRVLRSIYVVDYESTYTASEPLVNQLREDLFDDEEPEELYGTMPVQCHRCNGVTDIASSGGRCKYCGTPLPGFGVSGAE